MPLIANRDKDGHMLHYVPYTTRATATPGNLDADWGEIFLAKQKGRAYPDQLIIITEADLAELINRRVAEALAGRGGSS